MRFPAWGALLLLPLPLLACEPRRARDGGEPAGAASSRARAKPATTDDFIGQSHSAELRRDAAAVPPGALTASDPLARRAAARALACIADAKARELLLTALPDDDAEVLLWVAFGLGRTCAGTEADTVKALVTRAAGLLALPRTNEYQPALRSIASAIGRCPSDDAERTLRSWLELDTAIATAAALALGDVGARRGRLDEGSLVALLDAAARNPPLETALFAFTRLPVPAAERAIADRLLAVASRALTQPGTPRGFAIRALGRLGESATALLANALIGENITAGERAEITREIARHGGTGQRALAAALIELAPDAGGVSRGLGTEAFHTWMALLEALDSRSDAVRPTLQRLANTPVPVGDERLGRRAIALRCGAARLLAGRSTANPELRACDPTPAGVSGKLALLTVLGRGDLSGPRERLYRSLVEDADPRVRSAALPLIAAHRELSDTPALIARALLAEHPGTVAVAAKLLAQHPDRATGANADVATAPNPDSAVVTALTKAVRSAEAATNIEVHATLLEAASALGVLGLNAEIERACASDNPTLREHAERALHTLGRKNARCTAVPGREAQRSRAAPPAREPVRLVFETDAGELALVLEPALAPESVGRILELSRSGFYDGIAVHRAVPGFVVQLGDPGGDGYGGAPLPFVRCELDPRPFELGTVGMAHSGRDTGSSQFFVTLGRFPHLDGEYTRLGHAEPGWDELAEGDRVRRVRVEPISRTPAPLPSRLPH